MLLPFLPPRRPQRRRRDRRGRTQAPPAPPPPTEALIVMATVLDDSWVRFVFNVAVTTDGSDVPQLILDTYAGLQGASSPQQVDAFTIDVMFADSTVDVGQAWQINALPAGLSFAGGLPFALPQSGTTVSA